MSGNDNVTLPAGSPGSAGAYGPGAPVAAGTESLARSIVLRRLSRFSRFLAVVMVSAGLGVALVYLPPLLIFGALGAMAAMVAVFMVPFLGLLLYAVLYILRLGELYPVLGVLHLERVVGVLTLAAIFMRGYRSDGRIMIDWSKQTQWLFAFLMVVVISISTSYWPGGTVARVIMLLKLIAFYIMTIHLITSRAKLRAFVVTFLLLITYLAASSLKAYYSGNIMYAQGMERAIGMTSAGGDPNSLATTLAVSLPLMLLLALWGEKNIFLRLTALAGSGLSLWAILFTGSRTGILGLLTALALVWWYSRRRLSLALVGIAILVTAFTILPDQYKSRYATLTSGEVDETGQSRLDTWAVGLSMFANRPLLGVGAGCFGAARAKDYSGEGRKNWLEAHSLYVQVVAEMGVLGAVAFFGFLIQMIRLSRRTFRTLLEQRKRWIFEHAVVLGLFVGTIALMVASVFGHSLFRSTWYIYAAITLSVWRLHLDLPPDTPEPAPAAGDFDRG